MKFHQWPFKILRKQNATDRRTGSQHETVYPPQTKFAGGGGGIMIFYTERQRGGDMERECVCERER